MIQPIAAYFNPGEPIRILVKIDDVSYPAEIWEPIVFLLQCGHKVRKWTNPTKITELECKKCDK